ncbi:hypothetical protein Poli38472_013312 [Pythium oligandrum]|uniref:Amine oxidase domain-containing protein n=1 Tax=Pythium oligandrum TaxID=41045 RepID=A0A8K1C2T7_PYTOL|nr:hypothetical protein Poli38472_013312 [Pythium oligandrum]|eukprot:TMW55421.1 hypothetical protein Poli38472_013312 [Pythium oligandrum]
MCKLTSSETQRKRIAVIGGGISGLACAYLLQRQLDADVVLFEESNEAGGHALTVDIELTQLKPGEPEPKQVQVPVDVGFQVFNLTTYPHLVGFFEDLGVTSQPSDMSFGCSVPLYSKPSSDMGKSTADAYDIFEWSSTKNLSTIFPEYTSYLESRRYDLVKDVVRFQKEAPLFLQEVEQGQHAEMTVEEYLQTYHYSDTFRDVYMLPMIAAIWSVPKVDSMVMPIRTLIRFMVNHHLHKIKNRPKWRTVVDRSRQYVQKVVKQLHDVRLNARVSRISTVVDDVGREQVRVTQESGEGELFDDVVLATHTDVTMRILGDEITPDEKAILSKIKYQSNKCVLHTDKSIMPANRKLWASWNAKEFPHANGATVVDTAPVCCSYWVNLLQNLDEGVQDVFVTLNPPHELENTLMEFELSHPMLNKEAVAAQEQLHTIQGKRHVYFAGAWTRYGFHEDGILSAVKVYELLAGETKSALIVKEAPPALPWMPRSPSPIPPSRLALDCLSLFTAYARKSVTVGSLRLLLPDGSERSFEAVQEVASVTNHATVSKSLHKYQNVDLNDVTIVLKIHDLCMFPRIVFGHSSIAMAEAYMDNLFDITIEERAARQQVKLLQFSKESKSDDRLAIFLYWCALNLIKIESNKNLLGGPAQWLGRQVKAFYHWKRQFNTIEQAKKHISMHYDLGNDLYELFLDKTMTYSSGMFPLDQDGTPATETTTLEQISVKLEQEEELKLEHAFLAADIQDGHRVLEIGCGWGSMAILSCTRAKCRWTALTLSKEQKAMMEERVRAAGLEDRIEVLLTDFRELVQMSEYRGTFDRVVSLEMIEALGDGNLPGYFADINRFLKPETGRIVIQAITIPDDRYDQYCKNTDFIKEFIFPGGHLPSRARIYWAVQQGNALVSQERSKSGAKPNQATDLSITEEYEFGKAYASTLRAWRLRLLHNRLKILALTSESDPTKKMYDARFMRMFEWYFAYCEVGFQQGLIHVMQLVIENKQLVPLPKPVLPATLRANRSNKIRTKPFHVVESKIMTGTVFHGRHDGVKNAFRYPTVMALLSLDDLYLSSLFNDRWYMSLNASNILAFHRSDHFGDPKRTLKSCVLQLIQDECNLSAEELEGAVGQVFILTTIRCLGYSFNPISIYYCMSFEDPSKCLYVVLEVTNTPWLEKHCYVLRTSESEADTDGLIDVRFVKAMHVSPFFKMDCEYRIRLNHPGTLMEHPDQELRMLLELHDHEKPGGTAQTAETKEPEPEDKSNKQAKEALGKKLFTSTLHLRQEPLYVNGKPNHDFFMVYSMALIAWKALLHIHYHALKLGVKGQRIYRTSHPAYKGKVRMVVLYSMDLIKHLFVFAVALLGIGLMETVQLGPHRPALCIAAVAGAVATIAMIK